MTLIDQLVYRMMMLGYPLNIAGGEWLIIVFVVLVLILGTNKLPETARKLGRAMGEYNKTKNDTVGVASRDIGAGRPVQSERQKFEAISRSLGIDPEGKTTAELRGIISERIDGEPA